jgi:glutaredoxin
LTSSPNIRKTPDFTGFSGMLGQPSTINFHPWTLPMSRQAILYTRVGCHLCDDAADLLRQHGFAVDERDIDLDEQLRERYDTCVPVVFINGKERFRGRINPLLLTRLLAGDKS